MLRTALAAFAVASLTACSATTTSNDPTGPEGQPPPAEATPPPATTTPTPTTPPAPEKVTFGYSSVPLPAASLRIASIGGSSGSDVWVVASATGAASTDKWTAYHYDGATWTPMPLTAQTGRPSFGVVSLGGSSVFLGFSYAADIFQLSGSAFTKKTGFSVTSGYAMAAVGSKVYVGTQENFGAGPLYVLDGGSSSQVAVTEGGGGVSAIWGASDDDVWLARSGGLGHLSAGVYSDVDATPVRDVHGTAKDDVWTVTDSGIRHYDGAKWSDVSFPGGGGTSDAPRTLTALSKDEVVVTTYSNVYRYDGTAFVKESRASAPKSASSVGRIGKSEAWLVGSDAIARLAPTAKK